MDKRRAEDDREAITDMIYDLIRLIQPERGQDLSLEAENKILAIHDRLSYPLGIEPVKDGEQI